MTHHDAVNSEGALYHVARNYTQEILDMVYDMKFNDKDEKVEVKDEIVESIRKKGREAYFYAEWGWMNLCRKYPESASKDPYAFQGFCRKEEAESLTAVQNVEYLSDKLGMTS